MGEAAAVERLVQALEAAIPQLCEGCSWSAPFTPDHYESVKGEHVVAGNLVQGVGEGDSHEHPQGGLVMCGAWTQRRALRKYRESIQTSRQRSA